MDKRSNIKEQLDTLSELEASIARFAQAEFEREFELCLSELQHLLNKEKQLNGNG